MFNNATQRKCFWTKMAGQNIQHHDYFSLCMWKSLFVTMPVEVCHNVRSHRAPCQKPYSGISKIRRIVRLHTHPLADGPRQSGIKGGIDRGCWRAARSNDRMPHWTPHGIWSRGLPVAGWVHTEGSHGAQWHWAIILHLPCLANL